MHRTPLFAAHQKLGAKMIDFGGWEMPVQYSSIVDEHLAVRRNAGMFDISHMGEVRVSGPGALAFLNRTLTNDASKLAVGEAQYTLMCNERGGTIDDLYAYRIGDQEFLLVINASRIEPDVAWLKKMVDGRWLMVDGSAANDEGRMTNAEQEQGSSTRTKDEDEHEVNVTNVSDDFGAIAVQGPRVHEFIDKAIFGPSRRGGSIGRATDLKKNQASVFDVSGQEIYVARTGYTGEDGFEVIAPAAAIEGIWNALLANGHAACLQPCGLGARDTLRTEVCYPLYGHELDETTTPIEAGVGFFVSLEKGDFTGRAVLAEQKAKGVAKRCVAFKMTEKSAPPRAGYPIWTAGGNSAKVGTVTSGTQSPSLGIGIGLGYLPPAQAKPGTPIEIEIRGKRAPAIIVAKPIYRKA